MARCQKRPEICFCSFAAADRQHEHIHKTSRTSCGVSKAFYKKKGTVRRNGVSNASENLHGIVIRPIMNDALQQVGIGPFGHRVEEAPAHNLAARGDFAAQNLRCPGHHPRKVEKKYLQDLEWR
jgi:hypothetical protein